MYTQRIIQIEPKHLSAWSDYVHEWTIIQQFWGGRKAPRSACREEWARIQPNFFHSSLSRLQGNFRRVAIGLVMCGACIYVIMLIVSIEGTLYFAGLTAPKDVLEPGQLLPLMTGILALLTTLFNILMLRSLTSRPVRNELQVDGKILGFTMQRNGSEYSRGEYHDLSDTSYHDRRT